MSVIRTIALICATSMLSWVARSDEPPGKKSASSASDPAYCSRWIPWRGNQIYQGRGGHAVKNDGIEVWVKGRPERKSRQLGYMIYYLPRTSVIKGYEKCPDQPRDTDAVEVAKALDADAVIPLGRIDNRLEFRVIKYLPENSDDATAVTDEHVAPDFENTLAQKEESYRTVYKIPLVFAYKPPMSNYYPSGLHPSKSVSVIDICPDEEGKLTKPPAVVESSGDRALDEAAVHWATDARYKPRKNPGTGAPYVSCEKLRVNFTERP